jgi:hypothetical protein
MVSVGLSHNLRFACSFCAFSPMPLPAGCKNGAEFRAVRENTRPARCHANTSAAVPR